MADSLAALKSDVAGGAYAFLAELVQAGDIWEKAPAASGEGEAAWNPRQVAEHLIGAAGFFGAGIAKAAGKSGPGQTGGSFATADEAAAAFPAAHAKLVAVIDQVSEAELATEMEFGPLGKTNLGRVIGVVAYHLNDHAKQIRTIREA